MTFPFKFYKWLFFALIWFKGHVAVGQDSFNRDSLPSYQKLFNKGSQLIDSLEYKEGITLLKKAIKERKDFWEAYNKMAFAKIKLNDHKGAEKDLEMALKIAPQNYESLKLRGINFFLDGKFKESKPFIDTAVIINSDEKYEDAEIMFYQAMLMFMGKSYKTALGACETALDYKPGWWEIYLLRGEIRFSMKEYNYAIRELNDCIKLMPLLKPDYKAYKLRAKSKFEVGDFKGAVTDWNVYIEAIPKEEEAWVSRAAAKINMNDNSGAIVDLDEAIKMNGKNPVSYCYRGVAKGGNKSYVEALKDLDYSIKLKFDYGAAYLNRAAIKMASKDKHGACEDLEKADGLGDEMAIKLIEKYCKNNRP